jgi:predicted alpha/beta hydrolase
VVRLREVRQFSARDGRPLEGTAHLARAPVGAVVVASATGVGRAYYQPFADYLAEAGLSSLTFDYRGIGGSAQRPLRRDPALLHQWGEEDLEGALRFWGEQHPGMPLLLAGHSVGGQLLGLCESAPKLAGALMVASQSGYWRLWDGPTRHLMWLLWHLAIPAFTLMGHFPMRAFRQGEDLPKGVAREWARWSRHPDFVLSCARARGLVHGYHELRVPIRMYAIADDSYAPARAVEALGGFYSSADLERLVIQPADAGHKRVGHFGFFRRTHRDTLWVQARGWLVQKASEASVTPRAC